MRWITSVVLMAAVLTACSGGDRTSDTTAEPTGTAPPITTVAPPPDSTPGPTEAPPPGAAAPTEPPAGPPPTTGAPLPDPVDLPSVPVGPDGIEYRGGAEDLERTGPSKLAIDPAGGFHFYDPVGRRIWSFTDAGTTQIDTAGAGVLAVESLAAGPEHIVAVEFFFAPERHLVHRIGYDGLLLESIEIPPEFRLAGGFTGVLTGADGEIVLEMELGRSYGVWNETAGVFEPTASLTLGDTTVAARDDGIELNGVFVGADLQGTFGSMRYLGTAADGTIVVSREDVLQMAPQFEVLVTVEWYSAEGTFLGSARAPVIDDHHIDQPPGLAMDRDGRVYALLAREEVVEVVWLGRRPGRITR